MSNPSELTREEIEVAIKAAEKFPPGHGHDWEYCGLP